MTLKIHYTGFCLQGLRRPNNEDNFWCRDFCLPMIHTDSEIFSGDFSPGDNCCFAVFDGMGGEACGEAASYIAASRFGELQANASFKPFEDYATSLCRDMNTKVLEYAGEKDTSGMGTTAVTLHFEKDAVHGFNVGDSRCYKYTKGNLAQLSYDHVQHNPFFPGNALTQCLGIPESNFLLEPFIYSSEYQADDIFLLCSDGLCGMLPDEFISCVLYKAITLEEKLAELKELVWEFAAKDNVTIMLFEILSD